MRGPALGITDRPLHKALPVIGNSKTTVQPLTDRDEMKNKNKQQQQQTREPPKFSYDTS